MGSQENERKRGRPRADAIPQLILEGRGLDDKKKCKVCHRVFPRYKSLHAHIRTHTKEKPYICDFPGCEEKFSQSGNLKTHIYRHTLEKHFACPQEGCGERYTHSNRVCKIHRWLKVVKDSKGVVRTDFHKLSAEKILWIKKHTAKLPNETEVKEQTTVISPSSEESSTSDSFSLITTNKMSPSNNSISSGIFSGSEGNASGSSPFNESEDSEVENALGNIVGCFTESSKGFNNFEQLSFSPNELFYGVSDEILLAADGLLKLKKGIP